MNPRKYCRKMFNWYSKASSSHDYPISSETRVPCPLPRIFYPHPFNRKDHLLSLQLIFHTEVWNQTETIIDLTKFHSFSSNGIDPTYTMKSEQSWWLLYKFNSRDHQLTRTEQRQGENTNLTDEIHWAKVDKTRADTFEWFQHCEACSR